MKPAYAADELWGTFAVDDHLRPRAFIAETILFDRLVFPIPPTGSEADRREWVQAGWQPDRLLEMRSRLGSLAVAVPWSEELRAEWRKEYRASADTKVAQARVADAAARDVKAIKNAADADGRFVSREVLVRKVAGALDEKADHALVEEIRGLDVDPTGDVEVVVGYGSLARYRAATTRPAVSNGSTHATGPGTLFVTWDFLVPEDTTLSDTELLLKAVSLSRKDEFRDARRRFHEWRRKLVAKGVSVDQARSEMLRCLAVFNEITAKERRRTRRLTALQAVAMTAPLVDLLHPQAGMVAGVTLSLASMLAERVIPHYVVGERESVAALVHDSREAFGWRARL